MFEISDKKLIGFEALARLPAPDGTLIPPATFIPLAEEMRLIDKIGAWVLHEACRTATTWPEHLTVAVNLSPAQFESDTIEAAVADALKSSGLAPHRLELEITETLLLGNNEATMATLKRLKDMGVSIVMDDFGTGYSSLSYLWKFPFDKIKIDRSFMESFEKSGHDVETVVKTIIALGREMHMRVTVEGVETSRAGRFPLRRRRRPGAGLLFRQAGVRRGSQHRYSQGFQQDRYRRRNGRHQIAYRQAGELTARGINAAPALARIAPA